MQSSSTTSLLPTSSSSSRFSSKKWEASFGKLASSYGFGPAIPSLPPKSKCDTTAPSSSKPNSNHSVNSFDPKSEKDFESAFGSLSSSYGFAGGVPSKPAKTTKPTKASPTSAISSSSSSQPKSSHPHPSKDYQSAFGDLSSSFGFGGAYSPSWNTKK